MRSVLTVACLLALGMTAVPPALAANHDFKIAASGGDETGAQVSNGLSGGKVAIQSSQGATAGTGDVNVDDAISWSAHVLTLTAADSININSALNGSGTSSLILNAVTANGSDAAVGTGTINLNANISTGLNQTYNGPVSLGAYLGLTATNGGDITFASTLDGAHALSISTGGALTFGGAVGGTTQLDSLTTTSGTFSVGVLDVSNLTIITTAGAIAQTGAFTVTGRAVFSANGNAITLANAGNDFTGVVSLNNSGANNVTLSNGGNALVLGASNLGSGTLTASGVGISQTGMITQSSGAGAATFNAGAGAITLRNANHFTGAVSLNNSGANDVMLNNGGNALTLGPSSVGSGSLTISGAGISQVGAITQAATAGAATFNTGAGAISLTNSGNDFTGYVAAVGSGVSITDANDLVMSGIDTGNGGVTLKAGGTLTLPSTGIDAGTGNIVLASYGGPLLSAGSLSGGNVSLDAASGLLLDSNVISAGTVELVSGGNITQTAGAIATGKLTGSAQGPAVLTNAGNLIAELGNFSANGFLLNSGEALTVSGDVDGGSGDTLITTAGNLNIAGTVGSGVGAISLNANGGPLKISGSVNGNTVKLSANGNTLLTGTLASVNGTTLNAGNLQVGNGTLAGTLTGNLALNGSATGVVFDQPGATTYGGVISGTGTLTQQGPGTLTLDGANTAAGLATVAPGSTLLVGDSTHAAATMGGDVNVNGGTLGGFGTIKGSAILSNAATLAPGAAGSIGALTVNGDLTLGDGSQLDFDFGNPGPNFNTSGQSDHVVVNGNLSIGTSTLNVNNVGGMGPGLYNLFTWGSSLDITGGGFAPPSGMSLQILTVDKQINLVDAQGFTLNEWDANGLAGPGQMGGGSGTWSVSSNTWSDTTGQYVGQMSPQPGFAIFGGAAGTVTVDDGGGRVGVTGMQFISDGYHLAGDAIDLVGQNGAAPVVRVGSGATAVIDNALDGHDGLNKTDGGTLVLTASNPYTGTTTLSGGSLSVSSDASLGAAADPLDFEGGTLEITGTAFNQTARAIVWGNAGGGFDIADAGNTFTVAQALTGAGGLYKTGAGTLALAGANTFGGGITLAAGSLSVSSDANLGDASGALMFGAGTLENTAAFTTGRDIILSGAGRFQTDADLTATGIVSGSGALAKTGGGALTLTGANTFTGGTALDAGTLAVGNDQALGTGAVGMAAGTTLAFAANGLSLANAFALNGDPAFDVAGGQTGTISGAIADGATPGTLEKTGAGTLILTGAGTYTGGTTISAGTLQIGNGGGAGSIVGDVVDNGTLAFDRSDGVIFAGGVSGTGALAQQGTGTLILTGANTFTGGTTISAGTLQIGNGGGAGSIVGDVMDNGTLAFDRSDAVTFAGTISGSGSLLQKSGATLTLNGASGAFTGTTEVSSGSLVVGDAGHAGATLGGMVNVAKGAAVGGLGTLGGLDLAGTLDQDVTLAAPGTLHVSGDAAFEAGSAFNVQAHPDGTSDRLAVDGAVTIKGGSVVAIAQAGNWAPQTTYTIISAGGGVTGTFGTVSDNLAFLTPVLAYQGNAVELSLQRNDIDFADVALTPNEKGAATGEAGLGFGNPLYDALVKLDAPTARYAFDQTSGEYHASQQTARIDASRYIREAMDQRLRAGDADPEAAKQGDTHLSAWAHAWGHWGTVDSDGNAGRLADNGDGLLVGIDMPIGALARIGVTGGASRDSLSIGSRVSWGRLTSQWLGAFGGITQGAFALRGGVAYAWDQIPSNREVDFPGYSDRLSGNASGNTLTGFVEGAWTFHVGQGEVAPFVNLAHTRVETGLLAEMGGAAALRADANSANVSFGTVGARGSIRLARHLDVHGELGWQHAFGDTTPQRTLQFAAGGSAFTTYGVPLARNAGLGRVGFGWHGGNVTIDADYEGLSGGGVKDQAAKLNVSVAF